MHKTTAQHGMTIRLAKRGIEAGQDTIQNEIKTPQIHNRLMVATLGAEEGRKSSCRSHQRAQFPDCPWHRCLIPADLYRSRRRTPGPAHRLRSPPARRARARWSDHRVSDLNSSLSVAESVAIWRRLEPYMAMPLRPDADWPIMTRRLPVWFQKTTAVPPSFETLNSARFRPLPSISPRSADPHCVTSIMAR